MGAADYYARMYPWAAQASAATGLPISVILAQWGNESAHGESELARLHNNHGGIKYTGHADYDADGYAGYYSLSAFVRDYVRVVRLPFYDHVRAAATRGPEAVARAWAQPAPGGERYAESGYGGGQWLIDLMQQFDLARYDRAPVAVAPAPGGGVTLAPAGPAAASGSQILAVVLPVLLVGGAALALVGGGRDD